MLKLKITPPNHRLPIQLLLSSIQLWPSPKAYGEFNLCPIVHQLQLKCAAAAAAHFDFEEILLLLNPFPIFTWDGKEKIGNSRERVPSSNGPYYYVLQ